MSISVTHVFLLMVAATLWAPRAEAEICVDVNLHAASAALSHDLVAALEQEATAIWARYDVELRWQAPACAVEDASFDVLIERHLSGVSAGRPVLGTTQVAMTHPDRVPILVDYDATEKTLAAVTRGALMEALGRQNLGPQDMGRAFGRVVAHEIGHVLLGLPNHQRQGLMRESFQGIDMVRPALSQYNLSPIEIARLRNRANWIVANRNRAGSPSQQDELRDREQQEVSRRSPTVGNRQGSMHRQNRFEIANRLHGLVPHRLERKHRGDGDHLTVHRRHPALRPATIVDDVAGERRILQHHDLRLQLQRGLRVPRQQFLILGERRADVSGQILQHRGERG